MLQDLPQNSVLGLQLSRSKLRVAARRMTIAPVVSNVGNGLDGSNEYSGIETSTQNQRDG